MSARVSSEQDDVGVPLRMMLRDVQRPEAEGRAPVDVADLIARGEAADVAGLEPLALRPRDVIADGGLGPRGTRRAAQRRHRGVHRHLDLRLALTRLGGGEAEGLPYPEMQVLEAQVATPRAGDLEAPADLLAGADAEEGMMASALRPHLGRQRLEQLDERERPRASERHGDGGALALHETIRRDLPGEPPRPRRRHPAPADGQRHRERDRRHDELGAAGEHSPGRAPSPRA